MEAEMATFKNETVKQRKQIYQLEKERERYGVEAAEQRNLYTACLEEVKLRDMQIGQLQKELDGFRKAVDAKAKERDAMEREAKFAKAETEKVTASVL